MALADAYATAAQYRAASGNTDLAAEADIRRDLRAVSRMLDLRLRRHFNKDAAVTERTYYAPDTGFSASDIAQRTLFVEDIASTSGLIVKVDTDGDGLVSDENALASTDYQLFPLNAATGPEPRPYTSIVLTPWRANGWSPGALVSVTAIHGWPSAPPHALVVANIELTRILRLESPRAKGIMNMGLETIEQLSPEARRILGELTREYSRIEL